MNKFDPTKYSITVKKEPTEDGMLFVARVKELPDVVVLEDTFEDAYRETLEVISIAKTMFDESQQDFPEPVKTERREFSGRLPIRTSKSTHRLLVLNAEEEGVSLNAYTNQLLTFGLTFKESKINITEITENAFTLSRTSNAFTVTMIDGGRHMSTFSPVNTLYSELSPIDHVYQQLDDGNSPELPEFRYSNDS